MKKFEFVHKTESPEEFIGIKDLFKDSKKSFYEGEHGRISNEEVFKAIGEIFYDRVIESGNPQVKIAPRDIIEKIYREGRGLPPTTSNILRTVDFYKKFRTGFWESLLEERKEGKLIYYQPRFLSISDPENRFNPIRPIDRGRILELRRKLEEKIEPEEEVLPIGIPKIEEYLDENKEKFKKAKPFKSCGPMWVDFEKGDYLVERKEVGDIIERLDRGGIVTIRGKPACGKSVVLRNVGYRLAKDSKEVYIIDMKKEAMKEKAPLMGEVLKLRGCFLLIDDAHLGKGFVSDVLDRTTNIKILIATRDIGELLGGERLGKFEELMKDAVELEARKTTDGIINAYETNRGELTQEAKEKLEGKEYKGNLWLLTWALETYEEYKSVDREKILRRIKRWMEVDLRNDYGVEKASNIFFSLSVFYRYEIGVKRRFLEFREDLKLDRDIIDRLLKINEVVEEDGKLGLHHSKLAELYLEAIERFNLGEDIRDRFNGEGLFHLYVRKYPKECLDVIIGLERASLLLETEEEKKIRILLEELVKRNLEGIRERIESEKDIWKIGRCVFGIADANEDVARELASKLDLDSLRGKIESEKDIKKIGWCVYGIARASKGVARELASKLDLDNLTRKIESEGDIEKIWWCVSDIAWANWDVGKKLASKLDLDSLRGKIESEKDIKNIGKCVSDIADANEVVGKKLASKLDLDNLTRKIESEGDIKNIGKCVSGIAKANKVVGKKLTDVVARKIESEGDIEKIDECVFSIAWASKDVARELVKILDPNKAKTEEVRQELVGLKRTYLNF